MNIVDRIISPNIWDEQTTNGYWIETNGKYSTNDNKYISSKNKIKVNPNTTICIFKNDNVVRSGWLIFYDINNNYISYINVTSLNIAQTKVLPNNCYYMNFSIYMGIANPTYKNDICINESNPSINGKYFPYVMYKRYDMVDKPIYDLPEGYIPTDIVVGGSYGVVDLGTPNWYLSDGVFVTNEMPVATYKSLINTLPKILNTKYTVVNTQYFGDFSDNAPNNSITVAPNQKQLFVKDSSYTNATAFKNAMQGIYFIYEHSTPSSPTLVRGNDLNKYCIYNGQIGVYGDTFKYNSNISLKQWLRRLKIGG